MLESVIDLLPTGVLVYGADRRVRLINSAGRQIFGLPADDALTGISHRQLADRLLPRFAEPESAYLRLQPPTTSATAYQELALVNPDQRLLMLRACARDEAGNALARVILFQDVTESLADKRSRQEHMMAVAHDLKTPLTNIKAYAQLALMRLRQAAASSHDHAALETVQQSVGYMQTVVEQANRLTQLIVELVECSRAHQSDAGGLAVMSTDSDLRAAPPSASR